MPEIIKELIKVLTSDFMGLALSNMTGLALHASVPKTKPDENDEDDYSDEDEEGDEDSQSEGENEEFESDFDADEVEELHENGENKRKLEEGLENDGSKQCSSSSLNKKQKT